MLIYLNILEENDKNRFEKIYKSNYLKMYHIAYNILKQKEDAENVVQDAFVSLAENFEKYRYNNDIKMKSLCNVIVRNKAFDFLRKRNLHERCELNEDMRIPKHEEVETIIEAKGDVDTLFDLLRKLDEQTKQIFILKYYHDYKNGEIAKILNIPKRSVEMIIYRTKLKLKEGVEYD